MRHGWGARTLAVLLAAYGAACATGCSNVITVRAEVLRPARVPLRVFPRIVVVPSDDAASQRLGQRLIAHLQTGRSIVERASESRSERMLSRGSLPRGTVVVRVRAVLTESERSVVTRRQTIECGPLGCWDEHRDRIEAVVLIEGHVVLTVLDGPSGRSLQRQVVSAEEVGRDVLGMRLRVFERLVTSTAELVDQRTELVDIELLPVESRAVHAALDAIQSGAWARGRSLLELVVRSSAFTSWTAEQRALVHYDLGQAHRFDPSVPPDVRFERASESLGAAVRLDPQRRFAEALEALETQRRSQNLVIEQRDAASHNFRIASEDDGIPPPPASYR